DLLPLLDQLSPDRLSRQLRRLRDLGVIKRVAGTYRYDLTRIGRAATAALCRVTQTVIIPALAVREMLAILFEGEGHRTTALAGTNEALALAAARGALLPDVII